MKKVLALILALVLFASTLSVTSVAADEIGDNGPNRIITIYDAISIVEYLTGHNPDINLSDYDFDQNGIVNILDSIAVARMIVGG